MKLLILRYLRYPLFLGIDGVYGVYTRSFKEAGFHSSNLPIFQSSRLPSSLPSNPANTRSIQLPSQQLTSNYPNLHIPSTQSRFSSEPCVENKSQRTLNWRIKLNLHPFYHLHLISPSYKVVLILISNFDRILSNIRIRSWHMIITSNHKQSKESKESNQSNKFPKVKTHSHTSDTDHPIRVTATYAANHPKHPLPRLGTANLIRNKFPSCPRQEMRRKSSWGRTMVNYLATYTSSSSSYFHQIIHFISIYLGMNMVDTLHDLSRCGNNIQSDISKRLRCEPIKIPCMYFVYLPNKVVTNDH